MRKTNLLFIIFLFLIAMPSVVNAQESIKINNKNVSIDSIFSNPIYSSSYSEGSDNLVLIKNNSKSDFAICFLKAYHDWYDGKYKASMELIESRIQKIPKNESAILCNYFFLKGKNYFDQFEDKKAIDALLQADQYALKTGNPELIMSIKDFRANIYLALNNLTKAKEILDEGLSTYPKIKSEYRRAKYTLSYTSLLNQLAVSRNNKTYAKRSIALLDSLIKVSNITKGSELEGHLNSQIGFAYSVLENHKKAIEYYIVAQTIFKNKYPQHYQNLLITVFHEYYSTKDFEEVIRSGEEILTWIDTNESVKSRKKEIHQRLAEAYEKKGQLKKALYHTHKLLEEVEAQDKLKYSRDLAEMEEIYQSKKQKEEIKLNELEKTSLMKDKARKSKQLNFLVIAISLIGILLIIAIFASIRFNIAKKSLAIQSVELEKSNDLLGIEINQKNFLFRELHHRVKNNFQLVIGFMRLQQKYSNQMSLEEFIQQAEFKMNAMSMVHEMLYKEGNTESIELKGYTNDLCESIIGAFSNLEIDIDLQIVGNEIESAIEQAIPFGLVINELITNSIKHADQEELVIKMEFIEGGSFFIFMFSDNGVGFPVNFDPETSASLGTKAVLLLMSQINATTTWKSSDGAHWQFKIPK